MATQCQHSEAGLQGGKSSPAWSKSIWLFIVSHVIKRPLVCDSSEVKGLHLLKNIEHDSCMCQVHMKAFISVSLLSVIFQNSLVSRYAFGRIKHEHLSWIKPYVWLNHTNGSCAMSLPLGTEVKCTLPSMTNRNECGFNDLRELANHVSRPCWDSNVHFILQSGWPQRAGPSMSSRGHKLKAWILDQRSTGSLRAGTESFYLLF